MKIEGEAVVEISEEQHTRKGQEGIEDSAYNKPVTLKNTMKFAVPTILMTVFMSFYTMVDGLFVANLIGTDALSAINLVMPILGVITAVSAMLATGGSAVIMKKMGAQKQDEAREDFTLLIGINILIGLLMMILGYGLMGPVLDAMGLSEQVIIYCKDYLGYYLIFTIPVLLMQNFSLYMIAAGKANLSLICSIAGGVTNIILDYVLIAVFGMGIAGAALATGIGYSITALAGVIVFSNKKTLLHFKKPVWRGKVLLQASTNGASEMATNLVTGITTLMFNTMMLKYVGENGVAATSIIMYVIMFTSSLYVGYTYGIAPMISYYYGAEDKEKLYKIVKISLGVVGVVSVATVILSNALTDQLVSIFTRPDNPVYELATTGNRICSIALLFMGFNILASGLFTALSNGMVSAVLAFSRSFVFTMIALWVLPMILGVNGIWFAIPVAEVLGIVLSIICFLKYRKRYGY